MRKTKIWLIIATFLILIGGIIFAGVMTALRWDFIELSTVEYETSNYEINENFKNISVITDTVDVEFVISENTKSTIICHEEKNLKHSVALKEDTLIIEIDDTRKWYEHIGVSYDQSKITVYIPQGEYGTLSVKVSTGDVNITDIKCKNVISSGSTGELYLKNVIATEKFSIKRSTGDVKLDSCDADEILIKTDTGDVKGSLLTDKVFITETDTGSTDVPKTTKGGKCEITTDTGDIKITVG